MNLRALLDESGVVPARLSGKGVIQSVVQDSREAVPGSMFVAMPRTTRPSEQFLASASQAGATVALVATNEGFEEATRLGMAALLVPDEDWRFHDALWRLLDAFHQHPTRKMKVIGITGTNGKTTVAWLLRDLLKGVGLRTAYLGTLGFQTPSSEVELPNTTPFAVDLYNMLARARDEGVEALAMEVSSHALAERRADGVEFDAGVYTNLTQDHLDFHGTMAEYENAKYRLFSDLPRQSEKQFVAALNVDDPVGSRWAAQLSKDQPTSRLNEFPRPVFRYGRNAPDLSADFSEIKVDKISMRFRARLAELRESRQLEVPLGGSYNAENLLSAVAGMLALGFSVDAVEQAIAYVRPVPGRFEPVPNDSAIAVLVDYAHTPDALTKLLSAVKPLTAGRIITVFGCGGDRDKSKRPLMAAAAEQGSDFVVLTSDNPRTEDPVQILQDAEAGLQDRTKSVSIVEREEAVAEAIRRAEPGDVVVLAGKGHENYQIIGREKIPMDDRLLAREALKLRAGTGANHAP